MPKGWHLPPLASCSTSRARCLGEALQKYSLHHHHKVVVLLGVPGGSSTSAAPLERGIGGRRRTVRVTECGSAAICGARLHHDLEIGK
jgi:hypothetical protein